MKKNKNRNDLLVLAILAIIAIIGLLSVFTPARIIGAAETQGSINLNLSGSVSITLTDSSVDFGSGYVNGSYAILDSSSTTYENWSVISLGSGGWPEQIDYLRVENNGGQDVAVNIKSNQDANGFIGGTNPFQQYKAEEEGDACTGTLQEDWADLTTDNANVCTQFVTENYLKIYFKLGIPNDASTGERAAIITLTATAA